MSRQGTVCQPDWNPDPTQTVRMQNEGPIAGERSVAFCACWRPVLWRLARSEIGNIQTNPLLFRFIPPDQLLAFAPGLPIGARRSSVINDATICWPGKGPTMPVKVARVACIGSILIAGRKYTGINPATAGSGTVRLELSETFYKGAIRQGVAVDFLQNFLDIRLLDVALNCVVPSQGVQPGVARPRINLCSCL